MKTTKRDYIKLSLFSLMIILGTISFVSAGFFDIFKKDTQKSPVDVSVQVSSGNAPEVFRIATIAPVVLNQGPSNSNISVKMEVRDNNGFTNIDDSSATLVFNRTGETTRSTACTRIVGESSGTHANYTCVVTMQWYDGAGTWRVNGTIRDLNSNLGNNLTTTFSVISNTAILITPNSITFPILTPGATNQQSNNDPLIISNIGNANPTSLQILARNLTGQTNPVHLINSSSFAVGLTSGQECNTADVNTRQMAVGGAAYATVSNLPAFSLPRGDYVTNSALQENMYVCLTSVPSTLTAQIYSASGANAWDVQVS